MEGDQLLRLLRVALAAAEKRQIRLEELQEAIRRSSGTRRDETITRRMDLKREIDSEDGGLAERLRALVPHINGTIAKIDEMLGSLRAV